METSSKRIALVDFTTWGMTTSQYASQVEMVCDLLNSGRLGGSTSGYWGSPEHKKALSAVALQVRTIQANIRREEKREKQKGKERTA